MRPRAPLLLRLTLALGTLAPSALADEGLPRSALVVRPEEPLYAEAATTSSRRGTAERGARLPVFGRRPGPGCAGVYYLVGPLAWVCSEGVEASAAPPGAPPEPASVGGLPNRYYFVGKDGSFGYRELRTAEEGVPDVQLFPGFVVAVKRVEPKPGGGDPFGLTTHGLWVPLRDLGGPVVAPERLGVDLDGSDFAWVTAEAARIHAAPGGARRTDLVLARLERIAILERRERGRETWLRFGDGAWIRQGDTTSPRLSPPPDEARPGERWLDVDLERQVVSAYRGAHAVFATLASTGRGAVGSEQATPPGTYRVWVKLRSSDMDNLENLDANASYAIQAVPWVMYFSRGYALHGAFWHHAFGRVQSHGCVNLTPEDAERLFAWTSPRLPEGWSAVFPTDYEPGTIVRVR